MSNLQYRTLRYFIHNDVQVDHLGIYNLSTLGSLVQRGWLERNGNLIRCTERGHEAYRAYHSGGPNYRQHEGDLSDRVRLMLHISALRVMKAAS